jgi:hypothetical protein
MSLMTKALAITLFCYSSFCLSADGTAQQKLSLQDCIRIALEKHQSLNVSAANIAMAEAMYQQAMSAYWPQIAAQVNASRADQDRTFTMEGQFSLPSSDYWKVLPEDLVKHLPNPSPSTWTSKYSTRIWCNLL